MHNDFLIIYDNYAIYFYYIIEIISGNQDNISKF